MLALRAAGRLIGVVPLARFRDRLRGLLVRVIGSYNNEHASRSGILVEPGYEEAAARTLVDHLARNAWQWDVIILRQLPADAPWLAPLIAAAPNADLEIFGPTAGVGKCVLPLTGSWTDFLSTKSGHFRARLKENRRRIEKHGRVAYRRSDGSPEDFEVFALLEAGSWKENSEARLGATGWAFQREVALAPGAGMRCSNLFLEIDGRVVGGVHAVGHDDVLYSVQMLFDESVRHLYAGRMQFSVHVADAFADERYRLLDLNGNSEFCKSWSDVELGFVSLQVYSRRPYSRLLAQLKRRFGRRP